MLWSLAGLIGLATVAPGLDEAVRDAGDTGSGYSVPRAPDGQFYTDADIGGTRLRVMVDQRADNLLLSGEDAERLGLPVGPGFTSVTLGSVSVGPYRAEGVTATIAPDLPVSLLGKSFLGRVQVEVDADRLILR